MMNQSRDVIFFARNVVSVLEIKRGVWGHCVLSIDFSNALISCIVEFF